MCPQAFLLAVLAFIAGLHMARGDNPGQDVVVAPDRIATGVSLRSKNGKYLLAMQYDCNLVLYKMTKNKLPLWATNTSGHGANCYAIMQANGNFVLRDGANIVKFQTNTDMYVCAGTFAAVLQDDGNFVVYCVPKGGDLSGDMAALWATGTDGWWISKFCRDVYIYIRLWFVLCFAHSQ